MQRSVTVPCAIAFAVLLSGCEANSHDQAGSQSAETGTVTTIRLLQHPSQTSLSGVIREFEARHPEYRVEVVHFTGKNLQERRTELLDRLKDGSVDVVQANYLESDLIREGHLLSLEPYVRGNNPQRQQELDLDLLRLDGHLYHFPYAVEPWVLLYNVDRFRQAAVAEPRPKWTWEEFRQTARATTTGTGEQKVWGFWSLFPDILATEWLSQVDDPVSEKATREAFQFFATVTFTDGSVAPSVRRSSGQTVMGDSLFARGQAAMTVERLSELADMRLSFRFPIGVAALPAHPGATVRAYPQTLSISSASPHPEAAWAFLQFAGGPDGAAAVAGARQLPPVVTPAVRETFQAATGMAGADSLLDTQWQWYPRSSSTAQVTALRKEQHAALLRILSGEEPWEDELAAYLQLAR